MRKAWHLPWSNISLLGKNCPLMGTPGCSAQISSILQAMTSWGTYCTARSHCLCYGYPEKVSSVKFFKYISVKDSPSHGKHELTAPEAAYNTSPGQDWACHCLIMDGWIHKLNYWLLVDPEGGEVIAFICVPMDEPSRFQWTVPNSWSPRRLWLNLMGYKRKKNRHEWKEGSSMEE